MPTLSGLRRRGVPPSALRQFCEQVGISKADSNIDYKVLEDCIRDDMDKSCRRAFCILNPLKVTITNLENDDELEEFEVPRHPKMDDMGTRIVPFGKQVYIERTDFFDLEGPEGKANGNKPPRGFKRLLPGDKVRLRYAYVIQCDEVIRDDNGEPIELKCTYFPETRAGVTPDGEKRVKGIIHWVEATTGVKCKVNQYDRLFVAEEPGKESGDYLNDINPNSLQVLENVVVEPSVADDCMEMMHRIEEAASSDDLYHSELAYQFERSGYFALDPDSTDRDNLVFNRVVTLRDTWGGTQGESMETKRSRGGSGQQKQQQQQQGGGAGIVEDVRRVALRAATILEAKPHPEADSLLVCKVDCGDVTESGDPDEPRTVVAGLAGKIPVDDLIGKKVVCLTNLKPAKMRGIESTAMLLAASDGSGDNETVELLSVPDSVPNGELISFQGKETSEPDGMLKSKGAIKVWDRVKSSLKTNENGEATYVNEQDVHCMMTSAGPVTTRSLVNAAIQ